MRASNAVEEAHLIIFDLFHTLISFKSDGTPGESTSELLGISEQAWNTVDGLCHRFPNGFITPFLAVILA
jgi:hypothetical protein